MHKHRQCYYKINLISIALFLLATTFVYALADYRQYKQKGENHLKTLERLYEVYPFAEDQKKGFETIDSDFRKLLHDYTSASRKEKRELLQKIHGSYKALLKISQATAIDMNRYNDDLMKNFSDRLKAAEDSDETAPREKYAAVYDVSQRELYRAKKAFRSGQYSFSAHLHDRSMRLLAKAYYNLAWALPPSYSKLRIKSDVETRTSKKKVIEPNSHNSSGDSILPAENARTALRPGK